ncbi:hypothetical protein FB451DRAFT_1234962 [Mycena latifolia]|nr:hypothetical protein FB451DRAFT_1234962 [Mycena latifolia]
MPAISSGKVLVSGANGFVAAWVVHSLLEEGFYVRGAVRSESKGADLREVFASYGDKFELIVVPDMTQEGAFDEALKGVDAIEHTASPTNLMGAPEELVPGAVKGTMSILQSALKYRTSIKRVVLTSSTVTVVSEGKEPKTFSEHDWNNQALQSATELGQAAPALLKYSASKVLAERAAWDFVEEHKHEIGWDLVVVIPPFVFGPQQGARTPGSLRSSSWLFHRMLTEPSPPRPHNSGLCWVDVRDLGRAHVLALLNAAAGGARIIISAGPFIWQDCLDAAPDSPKYQKGVPGAGKNAVHQVRLDASKSARVLGMTTYRKLEETVKDTVAEWEAQGW